MDNRRWAENCCQIVCFLITVGKVVNGFPFESLDGGDVGNVALLREMHTLLEERNLEPLPDHIPLEVSTKDGLFNIVLQKNRDLDPDKIKVTRALNGIHEERQVQAKSHAFYQDEENDAVIHVQVKEINNSPTRQYTGTIRLGSQSYELHPVKEGEELMEKLQQYEKRDMSNLLVHSLKAADLNSFKNPNGMSARKKLDVRTNGAYANLKRVIEKEVKSVVRDAKSEDDGSVDNTNHVPPKRPDPKLPPTSDKRTNLNGEENGMKTKLKSLLEMLAANKADEGSKFRKKRSNPAITYRDQKYRVQLAVIAASDLSNDFSTEEELLIYICHLINGVHMAYNRIQDENFGIQIVLSRVLISGSEADDLLAEAVHGDYLLPDQIGYNIYEELRIKKQDFYWINIDHCVYLTTKNLMYYDIETSKASYPIGNSPLQGGCDPYYSYSVVTSLGYHSWMTIAHEIAHCFGSEHDNGAGCSATDSFLMSPSEINIQSSNVNNAFKFSTCSVHQMKAFLSGHLDGIGKTCLMDNPCDNSHVSTDALQSAPGKLYDINKQCKIIFNNERAYYKKSCNTGNDICQHLSCYVPGLGCTSVTGQGFVEIKAFIGTKCEDNNQKWCMLGKCQTKRNSDYSSMQDHCVEKRSLDQVPSDCKVSASNGVFDELCPIADGMDSSCERLTGIKRGTGAFWCHVTALDNPDSFFYDDEVFQFCRKNAHKFGLYFAFNEACYSDHYYSVSCPDSPKESLDYRQLCDGKDNCPRGTDEDPANCKRLANHIPFCYDDEMIPCWFDFQTCVVPGVRC